LNVGNEHEQPTPGQQPPRELTDEQRERFDALLQDVIDGLPRRVRELIDEIAVIVVDRPSAAMVRQLRIDGLLGSDDDGLDLCGLHTGLGLTERSVEDVAAEPDHVHLFRIGIVHLAGGFADRHVDDNLYEEIRITLLHELGHHFGLDEDDLDRLGFA
jgi:predicted Zn-dependent protease with MMP-like domain